MTALGQHVEDGARRLDDLPELGEVASALTGVQQQLSALEVAFLNYAQIVAPRLTAYTPDLPIHQVVDDGVVKGPFTETALKAFRSSVDGVLFDAIRNELVVREGGGRQPRVVRFGPHSGVTEQSSVMGILELLASYPGKRFGERAIVSHLRRRSLQKETLAKYIERLRRRLGDTRPYTFILTDEGVAPSVSPTGCAYYANPDVHWRLMRYLPVGLSATIP